MCFHSPCLNLSGKRFQVCAANVFVSPSMHVCFVLLKSYKIPIFNAAVTTKTIVSAK